ncbi:MAG TPA: hypothetical protein VNF47_03740 [Streptosporangiaceae bacterium]|nr:hypothetical protein [Streptosporangiaceae bacterium]
MVDLIRAYFEPAAEFYLGSDSCLLAAARVLAAARAAAIRPHEASLFDLQAKYAEVVDEETVLTWLAY